MLSYAEKVYSLWQAFRALYGGFTERPVCHTGGSTLRSMVCTCFIFLSSILAYPLPFAAAAVEVSVIHSRDRYPAGGSYPLLFDIRIPSSLYIHGPNKGGDDFVPTAVSFPESSGGKIEDIQFPSPVKKKFEYTDEAIEIYSGEILIKARLKISKKTPPGELSIKGQLFYQACASQYCLPPEGVPVVLKLSIAPAGARVKPLNPEMFESKEGGSFFHGPSPWWKGKVGFLLVLVGLFLGGLALNLTPCIYPLIPITVSYFGGMGKELRGSTIVHGLLYIAGLAFVNSLLGLIASLSGSMLGSFLQNPIVLCVVAGILVSLALSFFGLWEIKLSSNVTKLTSKNFGGYFGTFFMGLTLGTVAAPCLGPFILGLLTYVAQKGDPLLGFLYFFVLSVGMGLPLAILAIFSGALQKLPVSGQWMVWVRKVFGWALIGMAGYMLRPLISEPLGKTALVATILAAAGFHLGWLESSNGAMRIFRFIKKGLGGILVCGAVIFFLVVTPSSEGIQWANYDQNAIMEAAKKNRPVILDFYADWCAPCRALDKKVFEDPEVVKLSKHFLTIRVDLTRKHPQQDKLQELYGIRGVPTVVFLNRHGTVEKALRIESFVEKEEVLRKMNRLIEDS